MTPYLKKLAYTVAEAGVVTGLGRTTLYAKLRDESLTRVKVGGRTLITAESLEALVASPARGATDGDS